MVDGCAGHEVATEIDVWAELHLDVECCVVTWLFAGFFEEVFVAGVEDFGVFVHVAAECVVVGGC